MATVLARRSSGVEFLGAILAGIATVVICAFCPKLEWIAIKCIEVAVRKLPELDQERKREEWYAKLQAQPGGFWTLCWAIDLLREEAIEETETGILFRECTSLQPNNVSHFNTSTVTGLEKMFVGCSPLRGF